MALLTTHSAFRPIHLEYAVEKGVNVFMEKSFAPDPAGIKRIIRAGEAAEKKNLKIAAGLMCRHSPARQALIKRIRDGELGEIMWIRAYRMDAGGGLPPYKAGENELLWQIRRAPWFLWASSGRFIGLMVHQIDECCWLKDAWPISAHGVGGRIANSPDASENVDSYSIEYTFADGAKAMVVGRYIPNCYNEFATFAEARRGFSGVSARRADHRAGDRRQQHRLDWVTRRGKTGRRGTAGRRAQQEMRCYANPRTGGTMRLATPTNLASSWVTRRSTRAGSLQEAWLGCLLQPRLAQRRQSARSAPTPRVATPSISA